jgi:hypothetical protein
MGAPTRWVSSRREAPIYIKAITLSQIAPIRAGTKEANVGLITSLIVAETTVRATTVCSVTGRKYQADIEVDRVNMAALWQTTIRLKCPHCDQVHAVPYRDLYMDAVIGDLRGVGTSDASLMSTFNARRPFQSSDNG